MESRRRLKFKFSLRVYIGVCVYFHRLIAGDDGAWDDVSPKFFECLVREGFRDRFVCFSSTMYVPSGIFSTNGEIYVKVVDGFFTRFALFMYLSTCRVGTGLRK